MSPWWKLSIWVIALIGLGSIENLVWFLQSSGLTMLMWPIIMIIFGVITLTWLELKHRLRQGLVPLPASLAKAQQRMGLLFRGLPMGGGRVSPEMRNLIFLGVLLFLSILPRLTFPFPGLFVIVVPIMVIILVLLVRGSI